MRGESAYSGSRLTNSPHMQGYEDRCLAARGWTRSRAPSSLRRAHPRRSEFDMSADAEH